MEKLYNLPVDLKRQYGYPRMEFVQGDTDANSIIFSVTNDGKLEPLQGKVITVTLKKPDGNIVISNCNIDGDIAIYNLGTNDISVSGAVTATVEVYEGTKRLTSSQFQFSVREQLDDGTGVESTTEYPILTQLISDNQEIRAEENIRIQNEETRKTQHQERMQSSAEAIAGANNAKESAIVAATLANDKALVAAQEASNASSKAIMADEKALLAQNAANSANTAANLATDKATLAETKATLAQEKATLAEEKAALAQAAANNADAKSTLAESKATLAQTAANNANSKASLADSKAQSAQAAADNANNAATLVNSINATITTNENTRISNEQQRVEQFNLIKDNLVILDEKPITVTRNSTVIDPLQSYNVVSSATYAPNTLVVLNTGQVAKSYIADLQIANDKIYTKTTRGDEISKMIMEFIRVIQ